MRNITLELMDALPKWYDLLGRWSGDPLRRHMTRPLVDLVVALKNSIEHTLEQP